MIMNLRTNLPFALALLTPLSLAACEVGYKDLGGEGGTESGDGDGDPSGDGDGDPSGDGDGDPSGDGDGDPSGDGDGDGDGDCRPAPGFPEPVSLEFELVVTNNSLESFPLDEACTIAAVGTDPQVLGFDCPSADLSLTITSAPGLPLEDEVGDPVHVYLDQAQGAGTSTWMRVDFPQTRSSLFVIDAETLAPPTFYFPAPFGLQVVDTCGPVDDGCALVEYERLQINFLGETLSAYAQDYATIGLSEAVAQLWVGRAHEILEWGPLCDPSEESYRTRRVMIHATSPAAVEGEVCDPGLQDPCSTGLHCCYPCGVPDCEFVCTPEDPNTMECPPPPP